MVLAIILFSPKSTSNGLWTCVPVTATMACMNASRCAFVDAFIVWLVLTSSLSLPTGAVTSLDGVMSLWASFSSFLSSVFDCTLSASFFEDFSSFILCFSWLFCPSSSLNFWETKGRRDTERDLRDCGDKSTTWRLRTPFSLPSCTNVTRPRRTLIPISWCSWPYLSSTLKPLLTLVASSPSLKRLLSKASWLRLPVMATIESIKASRSSLVVFWTFDSADTFVLEAMADSCSLPGVTSSTIFAVIFFSSFDSTALSFNKGWAFSMSMGSQMATLWPALISFGR